MRQAPIAGLRERREQGAGSRRLRETVLARDERRGAAMEAYKVRRCYGWVVLAIAVWLIGPGLAELIVEVLG